MPLNEDYDARAHEQLNTNHVFVDTSRSVPRDVSDAISFAI
ncbi:hypothetical protein SynA1524_00828 [Synechococcus sp. A15-24]|nr:hypothetical protein SynA1524_00828 [Synechococcus sp. A15-24]